MEECGKNEGSTLLTKLSYIICGVVWYCVVLCSVVWCCVVLCGVECGSVW